LMIASLKTILSIKYLTEIPWSWITVACPTFVI
jgi:hypothetical protein